MIQLGEGEEFKDDAASRHMTVGVGKNQRQAKDIGEYVENNGYFKSVSISRLNEMKKYIEEDVLKNQDSNPIKGFKGQGYWMDLNNYGNKGDHWHQMRQYFWLKEEGKIDGEYMKVIGSGKGTTFLFHREKILQYFKDNPDKLPADRSDIPDIDPSQQNMKMDKGTSDATRKYYETYEN